MENYSLQEISQMNVEVTELDVFPQSWTRQRCFRRYACTPRPVDALFYVCTDIRIVFRTRDGKQTTAGKGDLVLIPRGLCYEAEAQYTASGQIDTYTVNFLLLDLKRTPVRAAEAVTVLFHRSDDLLRIQLEQLSQAMHPVGPLNHFRIKGLFYQLLESAASMAAEQGTAYYPIRAGVEALRREWNLNRKIESYAALCGVSPAYFYQRFRQWCGKSPVQYRNLLRMSNACAMLRGTDMSVAEISAISGFEDPFYFSRLFSREYGASPQQYRKAHGTGDLPADIG